MRILRSVSRRGFSVGTAGWFTVLRPNTWFPASRYPGNSRPSGLGANEIGQRWQEPPLVGPAGGDGRTVRWLASQWNSEDRNRVRAASALVGALVITSAMLWWIMHP